MKKRRMPPAPLSSDGSFEISDGSMPHGLYDTDDYSRFLSNGKTDNEKIEAEEYRDRFLR